MLANMLASYGSLFPSRLALTMLCQAQSKLNKLYPTMLALVYQLMHNSKPSSFPGWVGMKLKLKLHSAQLELKLGLRLAILVDLLVNSICIFLLYILDLAK